MQTIILLPPSEGKTSGGIHPARTEFSAITDELLAQIHAAADQKKLLGVKGDALAAAVASNCAVKRAQTLRAIERYTGVVYQGFNYGTLDTQEQERANKTIRIVSALFGLVRLTDALPEYKLSISKLKASARWHAENTRKLEGAFVIDLLPQAHRKAVSYTQGIQVDFIMVKNGKQIPAGHHGKLIKGRFARWLITQNVTDAKQFGAFTEDGFHWNGTAFVKKYI